MVARRWMLPAIGGVAACCALVAWIVATHLSVTPSQRLVDLDVYRNAGRSLLSGRPIYTFASHAPQHLRFTYPPFAALLAVPLAWLPFSVAGWAWTIGELACTAGISWFAFRPLWPRLGRWWPLGLGLLAGAMAQMLPFRDEIKFGQVDELLVLMCVVDCVVLSRQKPGSQNSGSRRDGPRRYGPRRYGGALVGLAAAIKLTPGVFIVYLFVAGRRRAATVAASTFVAATLLAAALSPRDSKSFWTDAVFHTERLRSNANTSNQSLRGMWLRAVTDQHLVTALWIVSVVVVGAVGFIRARRAALVGDEIVGVALTGLLAVLLSPVAWIHHLGWLPLVLGALLDDARRSTRAVLAAAVYAFFVVKVPWIGAHLLRTDAPVAIARIVQDGYGLAAVALLITLRARSVTVAAEGLAQTVTLRHNEAIRPGGPR
jgi:alpha-1,2-mannosyltransferase